MIAQGHVFETRFRPLMQRAARREAPGGGWEAKKEVGAEEHT